MEVLVDIIEDVALATKSALNLPVLNYQYGYVVELNETLIQWSKTMEFSQLKFPLLYLAQPFTIKRPGTKAGNVFGRVDDLRIFVINQSDKTLKAKARVETKYKPVIYPIYETLLEQLLLSPRLRSQTPEVIHNVTDRYYWGEGQQSILNDVVDVLEISSIRLEILKTICQPYSNL